jgi:hypothetical protein
MAGSSWQDLDKNTHLRQLFRFLTEYNSSHLPLQLAGPERVCTVLLFGAEIQPKHLVFCYLGFLPGFSLVFCFLLPPYAQSFLRKPSFLVLTDFFPWFLKSKQLLGFLGVVYMMKQGPNRNILSKKYYQS